MSDAPNPFLEALPKVEDARIAPAFQGRVVTLPHSWTTTTGSQAERRAAHARLEVLRGKDVRDHSVKRERIRAIKAGRRAGLSTRVIAEALGITARRVRTIQRTAST